MSLPQHIVTMRVFVLLCLTVLINGQLSETVKATNVTTIAPQLVTQTNRPGTGFRLPCTCAEGQCGCCTGVILDRFNQKACLNVTYEPEDFSLTAAMSMNGRVLYKRTVSGKNPPPMCFSLPRLQFITLCVEFSNIYFASRNVHLCVDMEASWADFTLVEWSFDCLRMGVNGVAVVGPEEGGGLPANPIDVVDQTDEDYDDSARNVNYKTTPRLTNGGLLIFENNLSGGKFDKNLIKIEKMSNGNIVIGYKKN